MPRINLSENMSISDLESWEANGGIHFVVARRSSFSFLVEPLAVSRLYQLRRVGAQVSADILHELPSAEELKDEDTPRFGITDSLPKTATAKLGLLDSLFGLALLNTADALVQKQNSTEISGRLQDQLWNRLQSRRGLVGRGDYVAVVSRDPDMPLPDALRDTVGRRAFPSRRKFTSLLKMIGEAMGITSDLLASPLEQALVTFLYEIAKNAHEHGVTKLDGTPLSGIRGITVQKIYPRSLSDIAATRSSFPQQLQSYLSRIWLPSSPVGVLVALSVTDNGPGIHHTLPSLDEKEGEWERLGRAFLPGESSKPAGVEGRGQGFNLVLDAFRSCQELRAFVFVRSANLLAYRDFTDQGFEDASYDRPYALQPWDYEVPGGIGSSLTVVWPVLDTSPRQGKLLFDAKVGAPS